MSEIFPSHEEPIYPSNDATWRQNLEANGQRCSDETAPDSQPDSSNLTDEQQTDPSRMSKEEVARARELVSSMFSGHSNETKSDLEQQFAVPRGWTTLIHGTDSSRWQLGEREKVIQGFQGLSVITTEDRERYRADAIRMGSPNAYDTTASYARSSDGSTDVVPIEARILFYAEAMSPRYGAGGDVADLKAALPAEMSELIRKYYQSRHPVVPRGETLVCLGGGTDDESGRIVEYFVPASVAEAYRHSTIAHENKYRDLGIKNEINHQTA